MATSLLLEGGDLEALLLRAHREGGRGARIVRAEKVRRGGVFGFFAREGFEVAVEIPEAAAGEHRDAPGAAPDPGAGGPRPPRAGVRDEARGGTRTGTGRDTGTGKDTDPGATAGPRAGETREAGGTAVSPNPPEAGDGEGLLGLADRASAAERAAARALAARAAAQHFDDAGAADRDTAPGPFALGGVSWPDDEPVYEPVFEPRTPQQRTPPPPPPVAEPEPPRPAPWSSEAPVFRPGAQGPSGAAAQANRRPTMARVDAPQAPPPPPGNDASMEQLTRQFFDRMDGPEPDVAAPGLPPGTREAVWTPSSRDPMGDAIRSVSGPPEFTLLVDQLHDHSDAERSRGRHRAESLVADAHAQADLDADTASDGGTHAAAPAPPPGIPQQRRTGGPRPPALPGDGLPAEDFDHADDVDDLDDLDPQDEHDGLDTDGTGAYTQASWQRLRHLRLVRSRGADLGAGARHGAEGRTREPLDEDELDDFDDGDLHPAPTSARVGGPRRPSPRSAVARPARPYARDGRGATRRALIRLGVPADWVRELPPGDRFAAVLDMLSDLPDPDIEGDTPVVAVVGPAALVEFEAHRTALDLAVGTRPRAVVTVPARGGDERRAAVAAARAIRPIVVAIESDGTQSPDRVRALLRRVGADVVIAVVEADRPMTHRPLAAGPRRRRRGHPRRGAGRRRPRLGAPARPAGAADGRHPDGPGGLGGAAVRGAGAGAGAVSALKIGVLTAAVVAGPPLYSLVETGELASSAAIGRGAVVALACTVGFTYVQRLAARYEEEWQRAQAVIGADLPGGVPAEGEAPADAGSAAPVTTPGQPPA